MDTAGVAVDGPVGSKPAISLPGGAPPADLLAVDLVTGEGTEATPSGRVVAHYVGVSWSRGGAQFDASWDRGEPVEFPLDGVIRGWSQGIPGMKVGGRRLLVIPPALGYGSRPPTRAIARDDTLVFVVDLVDVR